MRPDRRQLLDSKLPLFMERLSSSDVLEHLKAAQIINDVVIDKIMSARTEGIRRKELVNAVKRRGDNAFEAFYAALMTTGQVELASMLEPLVYLSSSARSPPPPAIRIPNQPTYQMGSPPSYPRVSSPTYPIGSPTHQFGPPPAYSASFLPMAQPTESYRYRTRSRSRALRSSDLVNQQSYQFNGASPFFQPSQPLFFPSPPEYTFDAESVNYVDGNFIERVFDARKMYANFSSPRGLCLVINNELFGQMPNRQGSKKDKDNISNLFKCMGYIVLQRDNLSSVEMQTVLRNYAHDQRHRKASSTVVVIMSHGEHDTIIGCDDKAVPTHDLYDQLSATRAPLLANKPKLWFIQACRGERRDPGFPMMDMVDGAPPRRPYDGGDGPFNFFGCVRPQVSAPMRTKPDQADMLVAYATSPQFVSWRNSVRGSWFIQAICEVFSSSAKEQDVVEMLTEVNYKVAIGYHTGQDGSICKQMPELTSRLLKKFYFWPCRGSSV